MGLQCQTLRGIGGYEYTENDKKRNENHISLFVFANFKLRVQEAWKKLKTTSRDSKEFKEVLTTWNKLDTEYLKLYNEEY